MDELAFLENPYDEFDDELGLVEVEAPKRRRRLRKNPEPAYIATPILMLGLAYLGWVVYNQTKYKVWNWTPWTLAKPKLQLRRVNPQTQEEQEARRQADLDRATEQMMAPAFSVVEQDLWRAPSHDALEKEQISFIYP